LFINLLLHALHFYLAKQAIFTLKPLNINILNQPQLL
jgi:hypothetical protein